ncbi:helix-turn-helix domain-containing protein [Kordia sp.]|uniref:helix-turn-helix domain-containing protein n=1 Tax=Kordia sp. TaxID=1965332 RepID=UPI003B5C5751
MSIAILNVAILASAIVGYFISISLVTISFYKSRANNYLSLALFLLTSFTLLGSIGIEDTILEFLNNPTLEYVFAVTLFTYFLIQIENVLLTKNWYKWLYLPFVCSLVIETLVFFYDLNLDDLVLLFLDNSSFVFNLFLIFWGRNLIKKSSVSSDKKHWLLRLNFFFIFIMIMWFISSVEFYLFESEYFTALLLMTLSFFSWWILYYGVFKLQLIIQKEEIHRYLVAKKMKVNLQTPKKVDHNRASKVLTELYRLMQEEELYKNPLLSRLDLANRLNISEGYLSKIINQETDKSVIQFVNTYRVESAKNLLHDSMFNKYSVEAIGMEAGFKSKSAFYKTFNTSLGMSPGAYRKLQKRPDS